MCSREELEDDLSNYIVKKKTFGRVGIDVDCETAEAMEFLAWFFEFSRKRRVVGKIRSRTQAEKINLERTPSPHIRKDIPLRAPQNIELFVECRAPRKRL